MEIYEVSTLVRPISLFSTQSLPLQKVIEGSVALQNNYDGFKTGEDVIVHRRFSEFLTLRNVLIAKGAGATGPPPLPLSWFLPQWFPKNLSRWEELNNFGEHLGKICEGFNQVRPVKIIIRLIDHCPFPSFAFMLIVGHRNVSKSLRGSVKTRRRTKRPKTRKPEPTFFNDSSGDFMKTDLNCN